MNVAKNVKDGAAGTVPARAGRIGVPPRREFADLGELAVGHGPIGDIAVTPDGRTLVVTNPGDDTVALIDADDLTERASVVLAGEPVAVAVAESRVFVATTSASYDAVTVVDTDRPALVASYPLDLNVRALAADPARIVAGRVGRGTTDVAVIDPGTGAVRAIELAAVPGLVVDAVRLSRDGTRIYAGLSDADGGELRVVSAHTGRVLATAPIGSPIRDIALSADGAIAYVLGCGVGGGSLQMIETRAHRVVRGVEIGGWPTQIALDGSRAYVVDRDEVLVMCTATDRIVDALRVDAEPSGVAARPGRLYVAGYGGSVRTVAAPVRVAEMPTVPTIRVLQPAV